jgi:hypothetical protein
MVSEYGFEVGFSRPAADTVKGEVEVGPTTASRLGEWVSFDYDGGENAIGHARSRTVCAQRVPSFGTLAAMWRHFLWRLPT